METNKQDFGAAGSFESTRGESGGTDTGFSGGSYGRSTRVQGSTEQTVGGQVTELADRAKDSLSEAGTAVADRLGPVGDWAKRNPWVAVGVALGAGVLVAGLVKARSGDAKSRIAKMSSDEPVGRARGGSGRTDWVAEKMSESADSGYGGYAYGPSGGGWSPGGSWGPGANWGAGGSWGPGGHWGGWNPYGANPYGANWGAPGGYAGGRGSTGQTGRNEEEFTTSTRQSTESSRRDKNG
jgi:hypothetical protein